MGTYLQFAIDKGLDYNCNQTRSEYTRGIVKGIFSRKSLRFSGPAPEKWPPRGSSVGAGSVWRFRAGDRALSYKRPRDRQQIVDAHPVRA